MVSVPSGVREQLRVEQIAIRTEKPAHSAHIPVKAYVALGMALVVWSSAFAGIRAGLRAYAPSHLALFRYLIASIVLAIYARFAHFRRPALRDIPGLVFAGSLGITIYNLALNYSHFFSNNVLNELRFGYLDVSGGQTSINGNDNFAARAGIRGVTFCGTRVAASADWPWRRYSAPRGRWPTYRCRGLNSTAACITWPGPNASFSSS